MAVFQKKDDKGVIQFMIRYKVYTYYSPEGTRQDFAKKAFTIVNDESINPFYAWMKKGLKPSTYCGYASVFKNTGRDWSSDAKSRRWTTTSSNPLRTNYPEKAQLEREIRGLETDGQVLQEIQPDARSRHNPDAGEEQGGRQIPQRLCRGSTGSSPSSKTKRISSYSCHRSVMACKSPNASD